MIWLFLITVLAKTNCFNLYRISRFDKDTIKKEFHRLAFLFHPDRNENADKKEAEELFSEIANCYEILTDPVRRHQHSAEYDLTDRGQTRGRPKRGHNPHNVPQDEIPTSRFEKFKPEFIHWGWYVVIGGFTFFFFSLHELICPCLCKRKSLDIQTTAMEDSSLLNAREEAQKSMNIMQEKERSRREEALRKYREFKEKRVK